MFKKFNKICLINLTNEKSYATMFVQSVKRGGETMGNRMKEVRQAKGMTQSALANKSGVSRGTIAALESGQAKTTTAKTLVKIASALDTTVEALFFADNV